MNFMSGEFQFIENLKKRFLLSKIGDDCAVLPKDSKTDLVITTDLLVEDIDFRLDWTRPEFLGHKALAVSLSDVAAMGAKPVWAMLSIGVPQKIWQTDFVKKFYDGWFRLAKKYNVELVGGDVSKTPDKIVVDSIAAGETKKGKAVLRSTANPGDSIFVTGNLGGAAGALGLLMSGTRYEISKDKKLLARQLKPEPQTEIGRLLGEKSLATAMIDLSDGLAGDLAHVCRLSRVGARIYADRIPFDKNLKSLKKSLSEKLNLVLHGGEDFELLFTVSRKKIFQLEKHLAAHKISCIGEVTANTEIIELVGDKKVQILKRKGFTHF